MSVPNFLNSIRCQNSSGVYGLVVNGIPLESCHWIDDPSVVVTARIGFGRTRLHSPDIIGTAGATGRGATVGGTG
jgi:hypothetical protein